MYVLKQLVFFLFTHSIWTEKFHRLLKHFPRETINILLAKGSFHNLHLLESDNNQSRKYEYDMSTNATLKWGTRKKKGNGTTVLTQIGSTVAEYTFQDFNFHLFALCGFVSCFFFIITTGKWCTTANNVFFLLLCCLFILFRMVQIGWNVLTIVGILGARLFA